MNTRVLGAFTLCMMSVSAVLGLRGLPAMATLGWKLITFYGVALITFLLPSALVCAELATRFPENAGIYRWVKLAFGDKTGLMAIWMEWSNNVVGFPTMLATIAATLAYLGMPALATQPVLMFAVMMLILFGTTFLNLRGIEASSRLNILGALSGSILLGVFIIILGIIYTRLHHFTLPTLKDFIPDSNVSSLAIFVSTLSAYSGMQVTAFHARNVIRPERAYPRGLISATWIVFFISALSALSISLVLGSAHINLVNGVIQSFAAFFTTFHLGFLTPLLALLIALSAIANLSAWLLAPARGMREALVEHGIQYLTTLNSRQMPAPILYLQAFICLLLSSVFLWMPSFKAAFWFLLDLTSQFTLLMYILVFAAAIRLGQHDSAPQQHYRMPGGKVMRWALCLSGILVCFCGFILGLFPPDVLGVVNPWNYAGKVIVGDLIILLLPLVLFWAKRQFKP